MEEYNHKEIIKTNEDQKPNIIILAVKFWLFK